MKTNSHCRLDHNADSAFEQVNARFQAALDSIEAKRTEVLSEVKRKKEEKKKVLEDQLGIIRAEKSKVDADVKAMQHQVEVRNITKKISDLNCKLDMVSTLSEPRENSYIEYISEAEKDLQDLQEIVLKMGQIKTSKTFPSLCRVAMDTAIANLETVARLTTINYEGEVQNMGGDPVTAIGNLHNKSRPCLSCLNKKEIICKIKGQTTLICPHLQCWMTKVNMFRQMSRIKKTEPTKSSLQHTVLQPTALK